MQPKISIIVPAYNAESYICKCVDSILAQQYADWELIIVDDGSRDDTPTILDQYAARDKRIHVVHQENQGVQKAREVGLSLAAGDFLCFVDSDDTLAAPNTLQLMINQITDDKVILVVGRICIEEDKRKKLMEMRSFTQVDASTYLKYMLAGKVNWALWGKLFNTACFRALSKPSITVATAEDALYNIMYCAAYPQARVAMVNEPVYNYYMRSDSVIHTINVKHIYDNMRVADYVQTNYADAAPSEYWVAFRLLCFSSSFRYGWLGCKHPVYADTLALYQQNPRTLSLFTRKKRLKVWLLIHCADFFSKYVFHNYVYEKTEP